MEILLVVGARPNFMKIAPVLRAIERSGLARPRLLHTGQHYDATMSDVFFEDLGLPRPDVFLGVGAGTHADQTARVMIGFEQVCLAARPDLVVVAGDVNSTLACALVAAKLHLPCAHVEAGLRSFDRTMPEEVNRVLVDRISDVLLTPSADASENLLREGIPAERIHLVGNVMIDSLLEHLPRAKARHVPEALGLEPGAYALLTLHRASNVDVPDTLARLLGAIRELQTELPVVFPVHPRTRVRLAAAGLEATLADLPGVRLTEPLGYLEFLALTSHARLVLTDSGGLQEETTALGIPCLTLRESTERPITVTEGTNRLVGTDPERIIAAAREALQRGAPAAHVPWGWDGHAADRTVEVLRDFLARRAVAPSLRV